MYQYKLALKNLMRNKLFLSNQIATYNLCGDVTAYTRTRVCLCVFREFMAGEQSRWIFTRPLLAATPSRKCGIDSDKELNMRQQAANLIQEMGQKLQVYPNRNYSCF